MLVREYTQSPWTLMVKWLILFALASAIAIAFAVTSASGDTRKPDLLPPKINTWAQPMSDAQQVAVTEADLVFRLWKVLDLHRQGLHEAAIVEWQDIQMPCETSIWKQVSMARAYLATGQIEEAATVLDEADRSWPDHPVVKYCTGLMRLQQAYMANEWNDAEGPKTIVLIKSPPRISPNSKGMYQLAAMGEFEEAILNADSITLGEELVPTGWPTVATVRPTVGDLLSAIEAEKYVGDSHRMLANWYLNHQAFPQAEDHLDAAAEEKVKVEGGYVRLGKGYEEMELPLDAARAYLKAMMHQGDKLGPAMKAWDSLHRAFRDIL